MPGNGFDPESRWASAWGKLGVQPPGASVREAVIAAYRAPDRAYHTLQHLGECFDRLDEAGELMERAGEVLVALWFHDAVYDTRSSANEADSAAWAARVLREQGAGNACVARVERLILATRHDRAPETPDEALLVDVDLAILGADRARFDEYEGQIRREYGWVPPDAFRAGRRAVLTWFLERPFLYSTEPFRRRFEAPARANLRRALAALEPAG